jgi:hypothetical protein
VVLLDEVNAVPSSIAELFFSTIRTVFNEREPLPAFRRYVFVMAGCFIPSRLVKDPTISPFNIARRVHTSDADEERFAGLVRNLDRAGHHLSGEVIDRAYGWTAGHPYLTQRLCATLEVQSCDQLSCQDVDAAVDAMMSDRNIEHVCTELDRTPGAMDALERIMGSDHPLQFSRVSPLVAELELLGVIKEGADGCCRIRNAIYRKALAERYDALREDAAGEMTRLENQLFEYFSDNVNRTCTYYEIVEHIWGERAWGDKSIEDRIYQLVARVRRKLEADPTSSLEILTVRGRGYKPRRHT